MNVRTDNIKSMSFKKIIKRSLQHVAASFGRHTRSRKEPQLLVLMYHRVLPDSDKRSLIEEPGMVITPETLRLHISILKQHFNLIKLSDWFQLQLDVNKLPHNTCAITFDDGWTDNFEFAFPLLKEMKVPATIFLVSDMIGTKDIFWPERLALLITTVACNYPQFWSHPELEWLQKNPAGYRFSKTPPTTEELSALIACAKSYTGQEIHNRLTHIEKTLQIDTENNTPSLLNWQQVAEMTDSGLVEIGSHTRHHVRLNDDTLDGILQDEIVNSKHEIEKHTGQKVSTFCFPNGDFCPQALSMVEQNYIGAVTTQSGWNTVDTNNHMLQRIGLHQDISADKTSFLARISGWM